MKFGIRCTASPSIAVIPSPALRWDISWREIADACLNILSSDFEVE